MCIHAPNPDYSEGSSLAKRPTPLGMVSAGIVGMGGVASVPSVSEREITEVVRHGFLISPHLYTYAFLKKILFILIGG